MNEIIRIHLAKTPYEIEIAAKKELQDYIGVLESHADEIDWIEDVEIRITEILAERSVQANGLVTSEDVAAVRAQLGEPEDFFGEGDIAVGAVAAHEPSQRRLYRDPSSALLAGVLSGIAHFLKINPVWTRIAFIILLFMSFGTAAIVYIVLWAVLPSASTAAAQLELKGSPVTLASLKAQRTKMGETSGLNPTAKNVQRFIRYSAGVVLALAGIGILIGTAAAGITFGVSIESIINSIAPNETAAWVALSLLVVSGLLLSALFLLLSAACFRKGFTKIMTTAVIAVIISGIVSFGTAVGTVTVSNWQHTTMLSESRTTVSEKLPSSFAGVTQLALGTTEGMDEKTAQLMGRIVVEYVVSSSTPRYEFTVDAQTSTITPAFTYGDNGTATLTFTGSPQLEADYGYYQYPTLKIYGPALANVTSQYSTLKYTNPNQQEVLAVSVLSGSLNVEGSYGALTAVTKRTANLQLQDASIGELSVDMTGGRIDAAVVRTLAVTQLDICTYNHEHSMDNRLVVQAVARNVMTYNGEERQAVSTASQCGAVVIGSEEDFEETQEG